MSFRRFSVFESAPDYVLENMFTYMQKVLYQKGHIIYNEGDKIKFLYFIKDGEVQVWILKFNY